MLGSGGGGDHSTCKIFSSRINVFRKRNEMPICMIRTSKQETTLQAVELKRRNRNLCIIKTGGTHSESEISGVKPDWGC